MPVSSCKKKRRSCYLRHTTCNLQLFFIYLRPHPRIRKHFQQNCMFNSTINDVRFGYAALYCIKATFKLWNHTACCGFVLNELFCFCNIERRYKFFILIQNTLHIGEKYKNKKLISALNVAEAKKL